MDKLDLQIKVPLLDLKAQYHSIQNEVAEAMETVCAGQKFILGPEVKALEEAVAAYSNAQFACGVSSGTDALLIALMAEGIGASDEVITTAYSFFGTAGTIARSGAKPVFVDIEPNTFNLNPAQIEAKITKRTKAIVPVHLFGQAADMDPILAIAKKHKLVVIEDAAQAIGAEYKGRRAGSMGDYGCLSFFPTKNLGGFGDGGMVLANDPERDQKLRTLRMHGEHPKDTFSMVGGNFRLDALQAAILLVKLKHLDRWTEKRRENAKRYDELFRASGLVPETISLPETAHTRHIFNQYVIRAKNRDPLAAFLTENGIGNAVYYATPLPFHKCFAALNEKRGTYPESEKAAAESLALPIYPELTGSQLTTVVSTIKRFY